MAEENSDRSAFVTGHEFTRAKKRRAEAGAPSTPGVGVMGWEGASSFDPARCDRPESRTRRIEPSALAPVAFAGAHPLRPTMTFVPSHPPNFLAS
jgi:hypothetical protein